MKRLVAPAIAAAVLAVPASAGAQTPDKTIVQTAQAAPQFSTLVSLVQRAGLASTLSGSRKFTVFAPTNAAFARVPRATLRSLQRHPARLRKVLLYHLVPGTVTARQVVRLRSAKTAEGSRVRIRVRNGRVFVDSARVTQTDIRAKNGVIHVVNRVLMPRDL